MTLFIKGKRRPRGGDAEVEYIPGGVPITARAKFFPHAFVVSNNSGDMSWADDANDPDGLLDLSNPAAPTIVSEGIYALSVGVSPQSDLTVGKNFGLVVRFDDLAFGNPQWGLDSILATAATRRPALLISSSPWYLAVGARIRLQVANFDLADHVFVSEACFLQRIS